MSVQALTQVDPNQFFNLSSTADRSTQRLDTKVGGVAVSTDFSGRLSVTTAEGDKITLSADSESDFRAVNYTSHAAGNGTTTDIEAKYAEYSLKQEFGVTVEGDLNGQEVKDLSKLFRKVANIFKKVLSGQDDAALVKTAKLADSFGDYSSLSGLNLDIDVERSVTLFAAALTGEAASQPSTPVPTSAVPATPPSAPTPQAVTFGPAPTTEEAIPSPSSDTTVPATPPRLQRLKPRPKVRRLRRQRRSRLRRLVSRCQPRVRRLRPCQARRRRSCSKCWMRRKVHGSRRKSSANTFRNS